MIRLRKWQRRPFYGDNHCGCGLHSHQRLAFVASPGSWTRLMHHGSDMLRATVSDRLSSVCQCVAEKHVKFPTQPIRRRAKRCQDESGLGLGSQPSAFEGLLDVSSSMFPTSKPQPHQQAVFGCMILGRHPIRILCIAASPFGIACAVDTDNDMPSSSG